MRKPSIRIWGRGGADGELILSKKPNFPGTG